MMCNIIFSATGCARCKMVKEFMDKNGITYVDKNMKAEGKEDFQKFYKENRKDVFRGAAGVEFPVLTDGEVIKQGVAACIGYLHSGKKLDGFLTVGILHQEWVDGFHVSDGNPEYAENFLEVLRYVKNNLNMKTQIETNGKNSFILQQIFDENLADRVIMNVLGPQEVYSNILGEEVEMDDIKKSIAIVPKFPEYKLQTTVVPLVRESGEVSYMTTEEITETAKLIEEATGDKKNKYIICPFNPKEAVDKRFRSMEQMTTNMLFPYRAAARKYQVFADVKKD